LVNIILQNTLSTPTSADELLTLLELTNPAIINTHFAPKHVQLYLKAIELNSNDTIIYKVNNLISKAKNNNLKLLLTSEIFNYFSNSKIMGQEEVAVRIAEQWLLNKDKNIAQGQDLFAVKTFVEFNKNSLIGMPAPELNLTDTLGDEVSLNNLSGEYTIIYFYSDDCISCKIETPQLINFLDEYKDGLINVYAVYTKDNTEKWKNYINKEFNTYNPFVTWVNVYDPNFSSGFELLYNVIKTPQIYLLNNDHTIIGRGLNVKALKELINIKNKEKDDFKRLLSAYFTPINNNKSEVYNTIDQFYNKSIKTQNFLTKYLENYTIS
jgi:Peroxiredoxin